MRKLCLFERVCVCGANVCDKHMCIRRYDRVQNLTDHQKSEHAYSAEVFTDVDYIWKQER